MKDALELFAAHFAPPVPESGGAVALSSLTGAADAFAAAALAGKGRVVLAVTPGIPDADRLADDLRLISSKIKGPSPRILELPSKLDGDKTALGTRIKTVAALRTWAMNPYPCVVVAPFAALSTAVATGEVPHISLEAGTASAAVKFQEICDSLAKMGYNRVASVEQEGDWSVRGGIVDAWSPGEEFPVRAEFFGDELESIRAFDAATQISIERLERTTLLPVKEGGGEEEGARRSTILDVLPAGAVVLALEHNDYSLATALDEDGIKRFPVVYTGDPAPCGVASYAFATAPLPGFAELGADEAHHPELFDSARRRLERHVAAAEARGDLVLKEDDLSSGFEIGSSGAGGRELVVVTKSDRVFTRRKQHRAAQGRAP